MEMESKRIRLPSAWKPSRPTKQPRNVDGVKYFTAAQIKALRRAARDRAALDGGKGNVTGVREWMAIDLLTNIGLRVSEAADVRCGNIRAGYGESAIWVRRGRATSLAQWLSLVGCADT